MNKKSFDQEAVRLAKISLTSLKKAVREEELHIPITDPNIHSLKSHIYAAAGHVQGSDVSRNRLHSQLWSTAIFLGPPSLWITINPCDLHDPIVQIFAGESVSMDHLRTTIGPDKEQRARNVARDAYAAAKYFHFLIQIVLETLCGIKASPCSLEIQEGVFGRVAGYFGTVESQGRGSLHLHLFLYLVDVPSSSELEYAFKTEDFRNRLVSFLKENIHAEIVGLHSKDDLQHIPNDVEVAWSQPPDPSEPDTEYNSEVNCMER